MPNHVANTIGRFTSKIFLAMITYSASLTFLTTEYLIDLSKSFQILEVDDLLFLETPLPLAASVLTLSDLGG